MSPHPELELVDFLELHGRSQSFAVVHPIIFTLALEEAYLNAITQASLEVEESRYDRYDLDELVQIVNQEDILN